LGPARDQPDEGDVELVGMLGHGPSQVLDASPPVMVFVLDLVDDLPIAAVVCPADHQRVLPHEGDP
jgi:hypothetical protein